MTEWSVRKELHTIGYDPIEMRKLSNKKNTKLLTYEQEQLILGSLLGDASLISRRGTYTFQVGHCLEQKEYLKYKCSILNTNIYSVIKDENSYSGGKEFFTTSYHNKYELEKIYNICFLNGRKTINHLWIEKLDMLGIAIWFMDDGTSSVIKNKKAISVRFSTLSFKKDEIFLLQNKLLEFNIETSLHKHTDGEGIIISVNQNFINKFMNMIEPHIVNCMKYKIKRRINEPNFKFRREN